ncbi:hypothetical protein [Cellulosimicrobium cellulans]|uniref:hypothetical protein n=1 Tax=Cellulosimicrobium cellulans TaxID=1710 RepID=UPI002405B484|nr:hypothetical protein [Cellulosimicrobium cellulans]MDF9876173.1 hypothetical protein [Cellulosimicrobium cellulans]
MNPPADRVVRTFRCPQDGRAVAQLVVRDGGLFLDVTGGRWGHVATLEREFENSLQLARQAYERLPEGNDARPTAAHLADLEARAARETAPAARIHPTSWPVPMEHDEAAARDGHRGAYGHSAPCPKCGRVTLLSVVKEQDERWNVVLHS